MIGRGEQCWLAVILILSWGADSDLSWGLSWGAGDHGERGQTAEAAPQAPCDTAPASASGGPGQCHPPTEKHDKHHMLHFSNEKIFQPVECPGKRSNKQAQDENERTFKLLRISRQN